MKSRWQKAEPYLHRSCSTYKEISTHFQGQQWHRPRRERTLFCSPICRVPSLSVRKPSGGGRRAGTGCLPCFSGWWRVRAPGVFKHVSLGLPDVDFVTGYQIEWRLILILATRWSCACTLTYKGLLNKNWGGKTLENNLGSKKIVALSVCMT